MKLRDLYFLGPALLTSLTFAWFCPEITEAFFGGHTLTSRIVSLLTDCVVGAAFGGGGGGVGRLARRRDPIAPKCTRARDPV
jgi:hypothetical protein